MSCIPKTDINFEATFGWKGYVQQRQALTTCDVCLFSMVPSCKYHHCSPIYSVLSMCRKDLATKLVRSSTKLSFFCFATGDVASRLVRSLARNWPVPWLLCYLRAGLDCIMNLLRCPPCQHCCLFFKFGRLAKFTMFCCSTGFLMLVVVFQWGHDAREFSLPVRDRRSQQASKTQASNARTCQPTHNL